jgi:hypothetical protein
MPNVTCKAWTIQGRKGKKFFFEKKNQKTFAYWGLCNTGAMALTITANDLSIVIPAKAGMTRSGGRDPPSISLPGANDQKLFGSLI